MKRLISAILAIALLVSLMPMAFADTTEAPLSFVLGDVATKTATKANGDEFSYYQVPVSIHNKSEDEIAISNYECYVQFDPNSFEIVNGIELADDDYLETVEKGTNNTFKNWSSPSVGVIGSNNVVGATVANPSTARALKLASDASVVLLYFNFLTVSDVEKGLKTFEFATGTYRSDGTPAVTKATYYDAESNTTTAYRMDDGTLDCSSTTSFEVTNGTDPVLASIEIVDDDKTAVYGEGKEFTLKALSQKGTDITGSVEWKAVTNDGTNMQVSGVSFASGKMIVGKETTAGTYNVVGTLGGVTATPVSFTVTRATISKVSFTLATPVKNATAGNATTETSGVIVNGTTWYAVVDNEDRELDEGVKFAASTVYKAVIAYATDPNYQLSDDVVLTVSGADAVMGENNTVICTFAATADKAIESLTLTASAETIDVPTAEEGTKTCTLTATARYDDNTEESVNADLSLDGEYTGVKLENGVLTIKPEAGSYEGTTEIKVTAEFDGKSDTKTITLNKKDDSPAKVEILSGENVITSDTLTIPTTGSQDNSKTYTAKVYDKYGEPVETNVTWNLTSSSAKLADSTVTVSAGAAEDNNATLTVTVVDSTVSASITLKILNKQKHDLGTFKNDNVTCTYGDTDFTSQTVTSSTGTVKYSSSAPTVVSVDETTGALTIYKATTENVIITATVEENETYATATATYSVTVNKKALTIEDLTAKDRAYDTTTTVDLTWPEATLEGVVGSDDVTVVEMPKTGTMTDANVGTGKTVTVTTPELTGKDSGNYTLTEIGSLTVNITPKTILPTVSLEDWTYGETAKTPSVTGNDGNGAVTYAYRPYDAQDSEYTAAVPTNAGKYKVRATIAATDNYAEATCENTFTIAQRELTITATVEPKTYDGKKSATVMGTLNGVLEKDKDNVTLLTDKPGGTFDTEFVGTGKDVKANTFMIQGTAAANYRVTQPTGLTGTITADKRVLETIATEQNPATLTKGGSTLELTTLVSTSAGDKDDLTFTAGDNLYGCTLSGSTLTSSSTSGSTLAITVSGAAVDLNNDGTPEYTAADSITIYVTIVDKALDTKTLKVNVPASVEYGAGVTPTVSNKPEGTGNVTYTYYNSSNQVVEASALKMSAPGTYKVVASCESDSTVYTAEATFEITARSIANAEVMLDENALTYTGSEQTKNVTSVTLGETTLTAGTDYTVSGNAQTNAGTYDITITGTGNYTGTVKTSFTIDKKAPALGDFTIEIPSNVTYDGTAHEAVVSAKTGINGMGAVTVKYDGKTAAPVDAGEYAVTFSVSAGTNYTAGTFEAGTLTIDKANVTLSIIAKNATYNREGYSLYDIDPTITPSIYEYQVFYTFYKEDGVTEAAPVDVGTYKVKGEIRESDNLSAATAWATFQITAKPLTADDITVASIADQEYTGSPLTPDITVRDGSVTLTKDTDYTVSYDANINAGTATVTVTGKGNYQGTASASFTIQPKTVTSAEITFSDETFVYDGTMKYPDTVTVFVDGKTLTSADFGQMYTNCTDAGTATATITFKGNYAGELTRTYTIEPRTAQLSWTPASFYYDGTARTVTASVTNKVEGDTVTVTVVGGTQTNVGSYTAKAAALSNANYKLPATRLTHNFEIKNAITSVTATPDTVIATVDGLSIKLVGTIAKGAEIKLSVNGGEAQTAGDTLTVNGVTYTVDKTGLVNVPANVTLAESKADVETPANADETTKRAAETVSSSETKSEGLASAAAAAVTKEAASKVTSTGGQSANVTADVSLKIAVEKYEKTDSEAVLTLDITPEVTYTYVKDGATKTETETIANSDIKAPVTIRVQLPTDMPTENLYVKHKLANGTYEYIKPTIEGGVAVWQQSSFSVVVLTADARTAQIKLTFEDGSEQTIDLNPSSVGKALPTDSKDGTNFQGWKFEGVDGTYKTVTDELLTKLDGETVTAVPVFGSNSRPGTDDPKPVLPLIPGIGSEEELIFRDVSKYDYFYEAVKWAVNKGVTSGTGRYTFSPNMACTRAQTVTFLWRAAGSPKAAAKTNPFTDVHTDDYFYEAVLWAVENGITNGTSKTTFSPNASVTRAQVAAFLWRANGEPAARDSGFTDVAANAYYAKAIDWAYAEGITTGTGFGVFSPDSVCTRAQIVTFLYRNAR